MVFVKVRETYDLHTVKNKMTVITIHTPKPDIIKRNYPGLLMQCRAYRPVSADVRIACASMMPLDVQSVGTAPGDVSPEDVFNPILYKAMSNKGMSQLEARINYLDAATSGIDVPGQTANVEVDNVTTNANEFDIYYGLLSNTHDWKHANPQAGLSMSDLRPMVYEMNYNFGDTGSEPYIVGGTGSEGLVSVPEANGNKVSMAPRGVLGKAKPFPYLNCTVYSKTSDGGSSAAGFPDLPYNSEIDVPYLKVVCGAIIIPPSRLHELFYRMVVEWTIEFSSLRPFSEIINWGGLGNIGSNTHYQNYSYESTKEAITGNPDSILDNDSCMVSANVGVEKVM